MLGIMILSSFISLHFRRNAVPSIIAMHTTKVGLLPMLVSVLLIWLMLVSNSVMADADNSQAVKIFVSILPQKFFVEQVGGDKVEVSVMVGPGQSPQTYEPSPRQMEKLSHTAVYFLMGMPFENTWIRRIKSLNPNLVVIDARSGITIRHMSRGDIESSSPSSINHQSIRPDDPHIWTDPMNVAVFMKRFSEKLSDLYPQYKQLFTDNYRRFAAQLADLDQRIAVLFAPKQEKYLLLFHPSWGYFSQRYGLQQIPIEVEGKSPNARSLASVIEFAKQKKLQVVFTQLQTSRKIAQAVANAIGGKVVAVDPLAEDYFKNMIYVAQQFAGSMQ